MFNTAYKLFQAAHPHKSRSKKPLARLYWSEIVGNGHDARTKDTGSGRFVDLGVIQSTPEALLEATKAYLFSLSETEKEFMRGYHLWLGGACFDEYEDEERKHLADLFDQDNEKKELNRTTKVIPIKTPNGWSTERVKKENTK